MPVSTGVTTTTAFSNSTASCSYCREYGGPCQADHRSSVRNNRWLVHLDGDLFHYLLSLYPNWFKDVSIPSPPDTMSEHGSDNCSDSDSDADSSKSPKAEVDDSPLQKCMDRNKQSLKVKLMMRRPYTQLVDQGIMPPLKTPASFHEQRQKLQRAKMGDLLKHKIQHRPDRTELIRQHILEDTGKVDPSLAERQRMLKRARLADSLNDQLSHRPGPLELIQKNILHTDENVERAVKEGQIPFRATCEGSAARPTHPFRYVTPEGDDSSSEGGLSPSQDGSSLDSCIAGTSGTGNGMAGSPLTVASSLSPLSSVASPAAASTGGTTIAQPMQLAEQSSAATAVIPAAAQAPPPPPPPPPPPLPTTLILPVAAAATTASTSTTVSVPTSTKMTDASSSGSSSRNRKKSKQKCPPKPRTIKFHEYKGPPNAQKTQPATPSDVETSYELLLQQQQLFLQWQLEWQHKYPQIILPASQKPPMNSSPAQSGTGEGGSSNTVAANLASFLAVAAPGGVLTTLPISTTATATAANQGQASVSALPPGTQQCQPQSNASQSVESTTKTGVRLEEMKVSDLKAELKKRNLPVSGSKPQLLERLRPFSNEDGTLNDRPISRRGSQSQIQPTLSSSSLVSDDGPVPSPPAPPSNASRRVSCSSLDGSVSSFRIGGNDAPLLSLSPASSAVSMSPSPASVRPPSVINMDVDMEFNESAPTPIAAMNEDPLKLETPPSPPPLPSFSAQQRAGQTVVKQEQQQQELNERVRGLQEEQRALLEQHQLLRQQAASVQTTEETAVPFNDPKVQQRLLLQQHIQLKKQQQHIQQQLQQLQQQQTVSSASNSPASSTAPKSMSRPAQPRQMRQAGKQQQTNARLQALPAQSGSSTMSFNDINPKTEGGIAGSATSKSDEKTAQSSLPAFTNLFSTSQPVSASTSSRPPPPDYSEASRLLQQQQQQTTTSGPQKARPHFKSQLVDDVLDILIRNGELPPSAAHDPLTPTTPRIGVNAVPFPASSASQSASSRDPPPPPPPLPAHLLTKPAQPQSSSVDIKFPDIDINELGLDLESFGEDMELGVYNNHVTNDQEPMLMPPPPPPSHQDDDVTAMELDVSDWLDTLLPPLGGSQCMLPSSSSSSASSSTSGFSSLGSDGQHYLLSSALQHQPSTTLSLNHQPQLQQQPYQQQQLQQQVTGDPLFSSLTSDPYTDLFALEDGDLKLPTGLGNPLSWDRLDFTA